MDTGLLVALGVAALLAVILAALLSRAKGLSAALAEARADRDVARQDAVALQAAMREATGSRAAAETRLAEAEKALATLRDERDRAVVARDAALKDLQQARQEKAVLDEKMAAVEKRMADWEKAQAEGLKSARAAILEVGNAISTKLIADHKQETEASRKESEEKLKQTTQALHDQFQTVAKNVATLHDRVEHARDMTDTVWRALSSPGGAGHFAEIGLENCLKSFGLERGRDFFIQQSVGGDGEGARLRPDATVLLPFDSVLVIDSKASKFLLELAEAEGTEREADAYASLARTMNAHLRALAHRDYAGAIREAWRSAGRSGEMRRVLNVMYLPNDAALEKLSRADPDFQRKAAKENIIVAGPTGLSGIIGFARIEIDLGRQVENQKQIVESAEMLLESVVDMLGHTDKVGKGLRMAAKSFVELTGSINARLLPRARRLTQFGVHPAKAKRLPGTIQAPHLVEAHATIEGEGEDVSVPGLSGPEEQG
jgi:DNA recombination protein RmuC